MKRNKSVTRPKNLAPSRAGQAQGVTEALKSTDPMAWVGQMDNIRAAAVEIVNAEIIFA